MDDAALVRQVLAGNTSAYVELVQRWAGRITALCHARVGRPDLAEELAQETFVCGFEELPSLAEPARFGPWLAGLAATTCRNWLESQDRGQDSARGFTVGLTHQSGEVHRLLEAVGELPEESRIVLVLFYSQKSSYRDIAQVLDVSPATVNVRLTRARMLLRERWKPGS